VPAPAGAITIHIKDWEGKPSFGRTEMRYNGEWVPYSAIGRMQAARLGTGSTRLTSLPAGVYELWAAPVRSMEDSAPPRPPVRVGLSAGEQSVDITVGTTP